MSYSSQDLFGWGASGQSFDEAAGEEQTCWPQSGRRALICFCFLPVSCWRSGMWIYTCSLCFRTAPKSSRSTCGCWGRSSAPSCVIATWSYPNLKSRSSHGKNRPQGVQSVVQGPFVVLQNEFCSGKNGENLLFLLIRQQFKAHFYGLDL